MAMILANPSIGNTDFPAMPAQRTPRQQWHDGYQAFCKLQPYGDMTTEAERAGYMAALIACADCETDGYLRVGAR